MNNNPTPTTADMPKPAISNYASQLLQIELNFMTISLTAKLKGANELTGAEEWADILELQQKIASLKEGVAKLSAN